MRTLDESFRRALDDAWTYVRDVKRYLLERVIVRWSIVGIDKVPIIRGDSAGAEAPAEWMLRPLPTLRLDGR